MTIKEVLELKEMGFTAEEIRAFITSPETSEETREVSSDTSEETREVSSDTSEVSSDNVSVVTNGSAEIVKAINDLKASIQSLNRSGVEVKTIDDNKDNDFLAEAIKNIIK